MSLTFAYQALSRPTEFTSLAAGELRECQVQILERLENDLGDQHMREPLVVGGNDVPGDGLTARRRQHLRVSGHVRLPFRSLHHVRRGELPVLRRVVESVQQSSALLAALDVQKELADDRPVSEQVTLERVDVLEPLLPETVGHATCG